MKKIFVAIVASIVLLLLSSAIAEQEGLYSYQINDDNTVTITGFDWANNHGDIYIPEMLGNRMVNAIGASAFATTGNTPVKITLPANIKSIGAQAFRGVSITYINIPLNTVEIGAGAFAQCSIMRFNVDDGHTVFATIENSLYNKQIKALIAWPENKEISEIPNGIKTIGDYAFYGRSFSSINNKELYVLPESIETIGEYAFAKATGLYLKAMDTNTINISPHAFEEAYIEEMEVSNLSNIGDYAFYKSEVCFTKTLSLSQIGKHAFENSRISLNYTDTYECLLSETPYEIEEYAFAHCEGLRGTVYLALDNVTSIGAHAFEGIKEDKYGNSPYFSILIDAEDFENLVYLGEKAFYDTSVNKWDKPYGYVNLVNRGLKAIPNGAFYNAMITDLQLGSSITEIGNEAFERCEYLQHIELNDGLLTIGNKAFYDCRALTAINIPASVTMIGNDVFTGCSDSFVVTVEAGSYGEIWARTCGYAYQINGKTEDTSWLND